MERGLECWGVGEQIVIRGDVWRDECHGGVLIVGHGRCPCEGGQSICSKLFDTQTRKHANTQIRKHANTHTRKHANTQTRRHADTQTRKHANTQTRKHANTPTRQHANTPTRQHANTPERLLARDHGIGRVRRGCRPSATKPGGERACTGTLLTWLPCARDRKSEPTRLAGQRSLAACSRQDQRAGRKG